jgi:hypothetical protein
VEKKKKRRIRRTGGSISSVERAPRAIRSDERRSKHDLDIPGTVDARIASRVGTVVTLQIAVIAVGREIDHQLDLRAVRR